MTFAVRPSGLMIPVEEPVVGGKREPATGEYYSIGGESQYGIVIADHSGNYYETSIHWNSTHLNGTAVSFIPGSNPNQTSFSVGEYTYFRGSYRGEDYLNDQLTLMKYAIYRIKN